MQSLMDLLKAAPKGPEKKTRIYTQAQALAEEISKYFNEPKKFGMYIGIIHRVGIPLATRVYADLKEQGKKDGRLFVHMTKTSATRI